MSIRPLRLSDLQLQFGHDMLNPKMMSREDASLRKGVAWRKAGLLRNTLRKNATVGSTVPLTDMLMKTGISSICIPVVSIESAQLN